MPIMIHEQTINLIKKPFFRDLNNFDQILYFFSCVIVKFNARSYTLQRRWSSGMMAACHAADPGSIPGRRKFFFKFILFSYESTTKKKLQNAIFGINLLALKFTSKVQNRP